MALRQFRFLVLCAQLALGLQLPIPILGARAERLFSFPEPHVQPARTAAEQFATARRVLEDVSSAEAANAGVDLFANVTECEALSSILQEAPPTLDMMGNFTDEPGQELLLECSAQHSRYTLGGGELSQVI